jgi:ADP-ribosylglycohydrolase
LIGDAAGGTLEFIGRRPTGAEVAQAMTMCGGGVFGLAPGQITDDGELSISLARALVGAQSYPRERVANHYRAWLQSPPFDIGNTIRNALSICIDFGESSADAIQSLAASKNQSSMSNGALMRSTPLGIWATRVTKSAAVDSALADAALTHPDATCGWASAAYVVAIRHLLLNQGDLQGAFQAAVEIVDSNLDKGASSVRAWLADAFSGELPPCYPQPGFVRIAFTHAFHHLLYTRSFEEGLQRVLKEGVTLTQTPAS